MRQISKLLIILATLILFSCNTGRQVVYRDCDCDRTTLSFGWGFNDPYWGWNNPWRWNDPYWSWRNPYQGWNNWYWTNPPIVRPNTPSRYERRQTIGERPSRGAGMENSRDNLYPTNPSRVESTRPSRSYTPQVQQRSTTPNTQSSTPSRRGNQNN